MNKHLTEQFHNPGADKRSIPFWAWNGKMDEEELKSQVRQMKQAGVGGFFIHSRIGLETEYLGTEWMNCVKAVVAEAKEQGLYAWLYDEDRWPSGTAGGRVTACGDAYRCKGLTLEVCPATAYEEIYANEICGQEDFADERVGLVAMYGAVLGSDGCVSGSDTETVSGELPMSVINFRRLTFGEKEEFQDDEVLLVVHLAVSAPSEWFNNEAPPDNLNPDCTRKFILETHEKYKEAVGEEFGKTIPGIFTDEPSLNDRNTYFGEKKSWIPWTYGFGAYFEKITGYDFFEILPLFYFHGENSPKISHDYWQCVTQRYSESYFKVISEWCEENNLLFTGHFLQEDKLGLCTRVNGAVMPHYQYQHVPGIDMLCEQTKEYLTVKQCTSVANQLGKKQVISETYGCTGWEFTFEGQKWMGDWQYVLGVNRRCQHLMLYSIRGCRKRDYPPSFNYNTNWWNDNKIVDDYFARLAVVLEQGEAVRNILLLHPASTAWSRLGVNPYGNPKRRNERDVPGINELGDRLNCLIEYLERQHLDCDLGDELLIKRYGSVGSSVAGEKMLGGKPIGERMPQFHVGQAAYQTVVLPPVDTLLYSTCEKLLAFMELGGCVYVLEQAPYLIEGGENHKELLHKLRSHKNWITVVTKEELPELLRKHRTIRITEDGGLECSDVLYQLRKDGDKYYLFLVNNSRTREVDAVVTLPFRGELLRMEPLSGEIVPEANYRNTQEGIRLPIYLEKTGSAVYCIKMSSKQEKSLGENFAYKLSHRNVLPLDMCQYRMWEPAEALGAKTEEVCLESWSQEQEIWQIQKAIREMLDMRPIHQNGMEQRYKWIGVPHLKDGGRLELKYTFTADDVPEETVLALERPEDFVISLNGQDIIWENEGWLLDKEIRTCSLPKLQQGENLLILSCAYRNDMELENIYLAGDFAVSPNRHVTKLPRRLSVGSWAEQGLKHYCGSVTYMMEYTAEGLRDEKKVNSYGTVAGIAPYNHTLKLPPTEAICVKLRVNGQETIFPWNFEREFAIGQWLHPGVNRIEVEVVGSPRNMMGPFHLKQKPSNTNDAAFCPKGDKYSTDYLLTPYGMMGEVIICE